MIAEQVEFKKDMFRSCILQDANPESVDLELQRLDPARTIAIVERMSIAGWTLQYDLQELSYDQ
jgi:hypothetical protein